MAHEHDQSGETPIVSFSPAAYKRVLKILDDREIRGIGALRVAIQGRGARDFLYEMAVEEDGLAQDDDTIVDAGDFKVFVDAETLPLLRGATVDYVVQLMGGGFRVDNPNPIWSDPTTAGIARLIDDEINPGVASHGGHVDLIDVKEHVVYVRLGGGCQGCAMVDVTLRQGIETIIKRHYPEIVDVVDTTDHAGGSNPYFQPSKGAAGTSPFYQPAKG